VSVPIFVICNTANDCSTIHLLLNAELLIHMPFGS